LRKLDCKLAATPLRTVALVFGSPQQARTGAVLLPLRSEKSLQRLPDGQRYAAHQRGWDLFSRQAGHLPAFELRRGGHPAEAVEAINELLLTHRSGAAQNRTRLRTPSRRMPRRLARSNTEREAR
jgi:hypothetical protein